MKKNLPLPEPAKSPLPHGEIFARQLSSWAPLLILLAVSAAYANSFYGAFVFDDFAYFANQPAFENIADFAWLRGNSRPVVYFTLALNHLLSGNDPWSYHLFNLTFHLISALLLLGIIRRTLSLPTLPSYLRKKADFLALLIATGWGIHPVLTMAVTYIWQRCESLAGMFYLLTLYCAARGMSAPTSVAITSQVSPQNSGRGWRLAAVLAGALAVGSKEIAVTVPLAVWLFDRTFYAGGFLVALKKRAGMYAGLFASWGLLLGLGILAAQYHENPGVGFHSKLFSSFDYILTVPGVILQYLVVSLLPSPLCFDPNWAQVRSGAGIALAPNALRNVILSAIAVIFLLALTTWALVKRPRWGFCAAWFFLTLAPTTSIMPMPDPYLEYRLYLPLAGIVILLVIGVWSLAEYAEKRINGSKKIVSGLFFCVLLWSGVLTFQRNRVYYNAESLWADTLRQRPDNWRAFQQYWRQICLRYKKTNALKGSTGQVDLDGIIREFKNPPPATSGRVKDDEVYRREVLGFALLQKGEAVAAEKIFAALIKSFPNYAFAHYYYGEACRQQGKDAEALAAYLATLQVKSLYANAFYSSGLIYAKREEIAAAVLAFSETVKIWPKFAPGHYQLGIQKFNQGQYAAARKHFLIATKLRPNYTAAWHNLGLTDEALHQREAAVRAYQKALATDANWLPARERLRVLGSRKER